MKPGISKGRAAVASLAKEYEGEGYTVKVEPGPNEVPEFLKPYAPDLLLYKDDEGYVVEVAAPFSQRKKGFWADLAKRIYAQPGWHFRIVILGSEDEGDGSPAYPIPTLKELKSQLLETRGLVEGGHARAALLLSWSLFEAAARLRMLDHDRDPARPTSPEGLIKGLIHYGYLGQEDFDTLREILYLRNAIAHGHLGRSVPIERLNYLTGIVELLLQPTENEG